jgi:outer membrane protein assembly factor BamA
VTPRYLVATYEIVDVEAGGFLDAGDIAGASGSVSTGPGVELRWDSRDDEIYPRSGILATAAVQISPVFLGSSHSFWAAELDYRQFVEVAERHILGWQVTARASLGDVPYLGLSSLGGSDTLRGYLDGRFRDRAALALQSEYRFPIIWRFRGGVFVAAGQVGEKPTQFGELSNFKPALGGGIRFRLRPDQELSLRLDYAWSPDGGQIYFAFNEAF